MTTLKNNNRMLLLVLFLISCNGMQEKRERIISMLRSKNKDTIVNAIRLVRDNNDTSMIKYLLEDLNDPRVTHKLPFKGKSIYQIKVEALEALTGVSPDIAITYRPDSNIIKFYLDKVYGNEK